jgi:hypothetical protein
MKVLINPKTKSNCTTSDVLMTQMLIEKGGEHQVKHQDQDPEHKLMFVC